MTARNRRHRRLVAAVALAAMLGSCSALAASAAGNNLTQLSNQLGTAQSKLNSTKQQGRSLSSSIAKLNGKVSSLATQISLVQSREATARAQLFLDEDRLAGAKARVRGERLHLAHLQAELGHDRSALAEELLSQYEQPQQSVVSIIIGSAGFQRLLDQLEYLSRVKREEESTIRAARAAGLAAATHLIALQRGDATAASAAATQTNALVGMNTLLGSRRTELADEQAAYRTALAANKARGARLQAAITLIEKDQAAAQAAAQQVNYGGGSGNWAIPYPIVLCESGGQNLPPNRAGASGYYQIIPTTWHDFGGTGPAAYLAPKSEQDAIASKIWNNGAGAGNWACSAIVGAA
jgi:septal ring factor EnvC (AmiA/AmiB activator)